MAGVGAPVIFVFQRSVFSRFETTRELISTHSMVPTTKHRCWRTDVAGERDALLADRIRDHLANLLFTTRASVVADLCVRQTSVLVDDPALIEDIEATKNSMRSIIV